MAAHDTNRRAIGGAFFRLSYGCRISCESPVGAPENSPGREPWVCGLRGTAAPEGAKDSVITREKCSQTSGSHGERIPRRGFLFLFRRAASGAVQHREVIYAHNVLIISRT